MSLTTFNHLIETINHTLSEEHNLKFLKREYGVSSIRFEVIEPSSKRFFKRIFFSKFKDQFSVAQYFTTKEAPEYMRVKSYPLADFVSHVHDIDVILGYCV
jgi:hypothetical protein